MTATQLMLLQLMTVAACLTECCLSRNAAVVVLSILHSLVGTTGSLQDTYGDLSCLQELLCACCA